MRHGNYILAVFEGSPLEVGSDIGRSLGLMVLVGLWGLSTF